MQEIKTRQKFKKIVGYIKAGTLKKVIIFNERKMFFMRIETDTINGLSRTKIFLKHKI